MPNITGTIKDASGAGVEYVVVRLSPAPEDAGSAQAIGGVGMILRPVEVETAADGTFTIGAVTGFRYRLEIPAIGYERTFRMGGDNAAFHQLGLSPVIDAALPTTDTEGTLSVGVRVRVNQDPTVREVFDHVQVQRSATSNFAVVGWTESVELVAGQTFYELTDAPDDADVYYRARYVNVAADPDQYGDWSDVVLASETVQSELALPVEELIAHYLFGVDLTGDDGTPYPRSMFEHYIAAAVAAIEKELDIPITPVDIVDETHDHYAQDYGRWGWIQLDRYPLIGTPKRVMFQYPSMTSGVEISPEWVIAVDGGASGVIQIVPGRGNIADVLLIPGSLMPLWSGASGRIPGIWRVSYRAGFEYGQLPSDIKHVIAMSAAIGVLNIAGDLIAGAGIATKSVSVPGLSQNIGTTSSATNSGYGSRIIEYQKEIKELLPRLRQFYGKTKRLVVV